MNHFYGLPTISQITIDKWNYIHDLCFLHNITPIIDQYIGQVIDSRTIFKIEYELNYYLRRHLEKIGNPIKEWSIKVFYNEITLGLAVDLVNNFKPFISEISNINHYKSIFNDHGCSKCKEESFRNILK